MQIMGRVERTYLGRLTTVHRRKHFELAMRYNIIGLVIGHR